MKWTALLALLGFAATASAQSVATNPWARGTTLEAFAGISTTPTTMGTYGGSFGWELTPRFEVQGLGAWFPRSGADEFAADLKLLVNLMRPSTTAWRRKLQAGSGLPLCSRSRQRQA